MAMYPIEGNMDADEVNKVVCGQRWCLLGGVAVSGVESVHTV